MRPKGPKVGIGQFGGESSGSIRRPLVPERSGG